MEPPQRAKLNRAFGRQLKGKRVACLGIPDKYEHMAPELIDLLWERVPRSVPVLAAGRPSGG